MASNLASRRTGQARAAAPDIPDGIASLLNAVSAMNGDQDAPLGASDSAPGASTSTSTSTKTSPSIVKAEVMAGEPPRRLPSPNTNPHDSPLRAADPGVGGHSSTDDDDEPGDESYKSTIDCGWVDPKSGERVLKRLEPWFGMEVEVYTAENDPVPGRPLYRASALAAKFNCATNKVGMYLSRRRKNQTGIFQAVAFTSKPQGRTGLKCGGYFLSLDICRIFEEHFNFQADKRDRRKRDSGGSRGGPKSSREDTGSEYGSPRSNGSPPGFMDDFELGNDSDGVRSDASAASRNGRWSPTATLGGLKGGSGASGMHSVRQPSPQLTASAKAHAARLVSCGDAHLLLEPTPESHDRHVQLQQAFQSAALGQYALPDGSIPMLDPAISQNVAAQMVRNRAAMAANFGIFSPAHQFVQSPQSASSSTQPAAAAQQLQQQQAQQPPSIVWTASGPRIYSPSLFAAHPDAFYAQATRPNSTPPPPPPQQQHSASFGLRPASPRQGVPVERRSSPGGSSQPAPVPMFHSQQHAAPQVMRYPSEMMMVGGPYMLSAAPSMYSFPAADAHSHGQVHHLHHSHMGPAVLIGPNGAMMDPLWLQHQHQLPPQAYMHMQMPAQPPSHPLHQPHHHHPQQQQQQQQELHKVARMQHSGGLVGSASAIHHHQYHQQQQQVLLPPHSMPAGHEQSPALEAAAATPQQPELRSGRKRSHDVAFAQ